MERTKRLADLIVRIYAVSQIARIYGLLYLEEMLDDLVEPGYLREGLMMIVNGAYPDEVDAYGRGLVERASSEEDRLSAEITREGITRVQRGDNPFALWISLSSLLGDDVFLAVRSALHDFERRKSRYFARLTAIPVDGTLAEEFTDILHDEFVLMPGSVIILAGPETLATALRGCAPDLQSRVLQNLPMAGMRAIMDRPLADPSAADIEGAMREIIEAYREYR